MTIEEIAEQLKIARFNYNTALKEYTAIQYGDDEITRARLRIKSENAYRLLSILERGLDEKLQETE